MVSSFFFDARPVFQLFTVQLCPLTERTKFAFWDEIPVFVVSGDEHLPALRPIVDPELLAAGGRMCSIVLQLRGDLVFVDDEHAVCSGRHSTADTFAHVSECHTRVEGGIVFVDCRCPAAIISG